jgi:hypothetical protein
MTVTPVAGAGVSAGVAGTCVQPALDRRSTMNMHGITSKRRFNVMPQWLMPMKDKYPGNETGENP